MAPTPPGTGVIAPATSAPSANATSPTIFVLPSPASTRLMPTSMTVAPGLIHSRVTKFGLSDRRDQDIGAARDVGQIARLGMRHGHGGVGGEK